MIRRIAARFASSVAVAAALVATPALAANPQVEFDTTAGKIRIELYPDAAPKTVANFLDYVKAKHYDGTQFHRVIDGFMIQGGGFTTDFKQKPTKPPIAIESEAVEQGRPHERARHDRDGAHGRSQLGDRAVLHQRRRQQVRSTSARRTRRATATRCSARWSTGMDVVDKIAKAPKGAAAGPPGSPGGRAGRAGRHQRRRVVVDAAK